MPTQVEFDSGNDTNSPSFCSGETAFFEDVFFGGLFQLRDHD